jgi:hypothetical protein
LTSRALGLQSSLRGDTLYPWLDPRPPRSTTGSWVAGELVSVSDLLAALAFAALHLVLVRKKGSKAALVIVLAFLLGCVAGVYRQTTGSLIPAVIIHMLLNIGGTIPVWLTPRRTGPQPKPAAET